MNENTAKVIAEQGEFRFINKKGNDSVIRIMANADEGYYGYVRAIPK